MSGVEGVRQLVGADGDDLGAQGVEHVAIGREAAGLRDDRRAIRAQAGARRRPP